MINYTSNKVYYSGIQAKAFEIEYMGQIQIIDSPDNILITASANKIIGILMDLSYIDGELFEYKGDLNIKSCNIVQDNSLVSVEVKDLDSEIWGDDTENWEDDEKNWDSKILKTKSTVYFNKKNVVFNNVKTRFEGEYEYADGSPVEEGIYINISNDGIARTKKNGADGSVQIYNPKGKAKNIISSTLRSINNNSGGY
jgi:hypothetical protein